MSDLFRDSFEEDMVRYGGRYYPPEPREECQCTQDTYWEPGSICGPCEARLEEADREPFPCCGAADPPCRSFAESCENPGNYPLPCSDTQQETK